MDSNVFKYCIAICRLKSTKSKMKDCKPSVENHLNITDSKVTPNQSEMAEKKEQDLTEWDDEIFDHELSQISEVVEKKINDEDNKTALEILKEKLKKYETIKGEEKKLDSSKLSLSAKKQKPLNDKAPILTLPKKQANFNYESDSSEEKDKETEGELSLLLKDIEKEKQSEDNQKPVLLVRKKKTTFQYETDSSDEEKPVSVSQKRKRILPGWMSK